MRVNSKYSDIDSTQDLRQQLERLEKEEDKIKKQNKFYLTFFILIQTVIIVNLLILIIENLVILLSS